MPEQASRLRVATVGAGYFSQYHHDAWTRVPEVELVAVCDCDPAKATATAQRWGIPQVYGDVEEMLGATRPDLVDIATPPEAHLEVIRALVARQIPAAICQKPFCRTLVEAEEAVRLADAAGLRLVVHENFRFQPWYGAIKSWLDEGLLGEVYQAQFRLRPGDGQGPQAYVDRQPYFRQMSRFLVHETAIHFIDLFRFLFGPVEAVFADLRRLNPAIAGEDAGFVLFRFTTGVRALFDGNRLVDHPARNTRLTMGDFTVEGSAGVLRLDGDGEIHFRARGEPTGRLCAYPWTDAGFGGDSVLRLQQAVVDGLLGKVGADPALPNEAAAYLRNLEIEEAIYRSAESGQMVRLD